MRDHVTEQAMLTLLEYLDDTKTRRDKCAVIKEFGIAAYILSLIHI